jgi:hypothetical protein
MLEHYYRHFEASDITVLCTEDLHTRPAQVLGELAAFIGLEPFDFTDAVAKVRMVSSFTFFPLFSTRQVVMSA